MNGAPILSRFVAPQMFTRYTFTVVGDEVSLYYTQFRVIYDYHP
jgi:hypothetical protein